jgi:hypothetical protein
LEVTAFADQKVLLAKRWDDASQVFIVHHFDQVPTEVELPIPPGRWSRILDSDDARWGGKGSPTGRVFQSSGDVRLFLGPFAFLVLQSGDVNK